ncbi:hypothetical protein HY792_04160 [Candidatus Desantisbacteria bacterium]|nr:hypothetical protein [Candidatus Desantisbacteria bacterium]
MFKHLLLFLVLFMIAKPAEADIMLKHYEISLVCSKNTVQCERVTLKYTYAERNKNIQSFPGQNTYKVNVVSSEGRTLKTLYLLVDKKASSITQKDSMFEEEEKEVNPKQKSYKLIQSSNLYKGDSLYKVKRKVKQNIEEQAIEDEKMKILDKQSITLNIPYLENASRIDIYNTAGQKVQTIRLDGK